MDENYKFALDWDLLVRFRDAGARFGHIPRFLGAFRVHETKTSSEINDVGFKEMNKIRLRTIGKLPTKAEIKRKVLPFILRHIVVDMFYRIQTRLKK